MNYEVGFNIPAEKGMSLEDVQTPALMIDYDIFFENMLKMKNFVKSKQVFLRPHAKMHKSPKIAEIQHKFGGARGICCQKVSEAEGIEGWMQSKITKAADYMGSVFHALDYETKFYEYNA